LNRCLLHLKNLIENEQKYLKRSNILPTFRRFNRYKCGIQIFTYFISNLGDRKVAQNHSSPLIIVNNFEFKTIAFVGQIAFLMIEKRQCPKMGINAI